MPWGTLHLVQSCLRVEHHQLTERFQSMIRSEDSICSN